jgi:hypothetical protein
LLLPHPIMVAQQRPRLHQRLPHFFFALPFAALAVACTAFPDPAAARKVKAMYSPPSVTAPAIASAGKVMAYSLSRGNSPRKGLLSSIKGCSGKVRVKKEG